MSSVLLFALCCAGDAAEPAALKELHWTDTLYHAKVDVDAFPTNARNLQLVTVRMKMKDKLSVVVCDLKLDLSTRDPRTKIHVIYPKASKYDVVKPHYWVQEGELAIQAIIERAPGDQSPVQGRLDFRVMRSGV